MSIKLPLFSVSVDKQFDKSLDFVTLEIISYNMLSVKLPSSITGKYKSMNKYYSGVFKENK